jgi:hypothetical protein
MAVDAHASIGERCHSPDCGSAVAEGRRWCAAHCELLDGVRASISGRKVDRPAPSLATVTVTYAAPTAEAKAPPRVMRSAAHVQACILDELSRRPDANLTVLAERLGYVPGSTSIARAAHALADRGKIQTVDGRWRLNHHSPARRRTAADTQALILAALAAGPVRAVDLPEAAGLARRSSSLARARRALLDSGQIVVAGNAVAGVYSEVVP